MSKKMDRRTFLRASALAAAGLATTGFNFPLPRNLRKQTAALRSGQFSDKVIVLGMDGVDPDLVQRFVSEGLLPTFKKMIEQGRFGKLATTNPPQSPVAWASFATGTNPGGHGIFDFVHRDPSSFTPYLSTSRSFDSSSHLDLGNFRLPLGSGHVSLMRKGVPLWDILEEHGVPTTVCQIPSNFPIVPSKTKAVSGMGTPDLLGTYGTYTFFTESPFTGPLDSAGGRVIKIRLKEHAATLELEGPRNPMRADGKPIMVPLSVSRDPSRPVVKIDLQDQSVMLKEGEWSSWTPLRFEYIPFFASTAGMVRFYVKRVHPTLELYVSPIDIDPLEPSLPISSPPSYTKELAEAIGRFHTQGFPADTKALSTGVFTDDEFVIQSKMVLEESMHLLEYQLAHFDEGFFFFYFSSTDQGGHMLWRTMHPEHPLYNDKASDEVKNSLRAFYQRMDDALRMVLDKADGQTTIMALSDHGFSPFTREFNLSTWLMEQGYTPLKNPAKQESCDVYNEVAWDRTKAYALGINGLYLNLRGREQQGIVNSAEAATLKAEIAAKLLTVTDPQTGLRVCDAVHDTAQIYSGPHLDLAPDLILGYNRGYRISDEAVLGKFPREIIRNRTDAWSADHCMNASLVPGMFLSTKELKNTQPAIWDLAPSILGLFGISPAEGMTKSIF